MLRRFQFFLSSKVGTGNVRSSWVATLTFVAALLLAVMPQSMAAQTSFGSVALGSSSTSPVSVTVQITATGTVGSITALSQGASTGEFKVATGGSCGSGAVNAGTSCTVNVTFTPNFSGVRNGAIVLEDSADNLVLGTAYITGMGMGPQITFPSPLPASISISGPTVYGEGVAVDGAGNVYGADNTGILHKTAPVVNATTGQVTYPASAAIYSVAPSPLNSVAVDGGGNVYITDPNAAVLLLPLLPNGSYAAPVPIGSGWVNPIGVAVDGAGNVYVADAGIPGVFEMTLSNSSYSAPVALPAPIGGWGAPVSVAVDGSGNVYVVDQNNNSVFEIALSGGSYAAAVAIAGAGTNNSVDDPNGVAVDDNGDVYVSAYYSGLLLLTPNGSGFTEQTIVSGETILCVAVDNAGNVYFGSNATEGFDILGVYPLATPPKLSFGSVAVGSSSTSTEVTVQNIGNTALDLSTISYPTDFPSAVSTSNPSQAADCAAGSTLPAGGNCPLYIEFAPSVASLSETQPLTESVTIDSNAVPAKQTIAVSGTATKAFPSVTLTASDNPSVVGNPVILTATLTGPSALPAPTGTVDFAIGGTAITGCSAASLTSGVATCTTSSLSAVGLYHIAAVYSGDTNYQATASMILTEYIVAAPVATAPPVTSAGAVNTGGTGSATVTFTFSTGATLEGISVLTEGAPNMDFTLAKTQAVSGSCVTDHDYAAKATCTVTVTFTPKFAGLRLGAVVLTDNATPANVIGTAYVSGIGTGAQIAFLPGTLSSGLDSTKSFGYPDGVAVDGSGNIYVADDDHGIVWEMTLSNGAYSAPAVLGGGTVSTPNLQYACPEAVAVDGAGIIYVADSCSGIYQIVPLPGGAYAQNFLGSGWSNSSGVAVDASGNIYVADDRNASGAGGVYELTPSNGSYVQTTLASDLDDPWSIAVDTSGNLYVANTHSEFTGASGSVIKLTPSGSSYKQSSLGGGWIDPSGVAVDGDGNVYVADDGWHLGPQYGSVAKLTPQANGSYIQSTVIPTSQLSRPEDVAVDGAGNLYVVDSNTENAYKLDIADPPGPVSAPLIFADTPMDWTSVDSPQTIMVENTGNAALTFSALSYPADFPEATGVGTDCAKSTTLAANGTCTLSIDFTPTASVAANTSQLLTEALSLTSNAINASGAQTISVSGNEDQASAMVTVTSSLNPGWVGNPVTFTVVVASGSGTLGIAPTGTVTLVNGSTPITECSAVALTAVSGSSNSSTASCSTSSLTSGADSIQANYAAGNLPDSSGYMPEYILVVPPATGLFGDTSVGTANIGSSIPTPASVTITFDSSETLSGIEVLTEGSANGDFSSAGSCTQQVLPTVRSVARPMNFIIMSAGPSACACGQAYSAGNSCTVSVNFTPQFAGPRYGAVVLVGSTGSVVGTGYLQGAGVGPQTIFAVPTEVETGSICKECVDSLLALKPMTGALPAVPSPLEILPIGGEQLDYLPGYQSAIDKGWSYPYGIAVDGSGNVYIADGDDEVVVKETYSKSAAGVVTYTSSQLPTVDPEGWYLPVGVALDGAGNVYVADAMDEYVVKDTLQPDGSYVASVVDPNSEYCYPTGVAVDGSGNVYVADNRCAGVYKETLLNGGVYIQSGVDTRNFESPAGVAVDGSGNVYVTSESEGGSSVAEEMLQANGSYTVSFINGAWEYPVGIAVDDNGNVYVADPEAGVVVRETPSKGSYTAINIGEWFSPYELALSPSGNLYVADDGTNGCGIGCFNNEDVAAAKHSKGRITAARPNQRLHPASRSFSRKADPAAILSGGSTGTMSSIPSVYMADFVDPPSMGFATTAYLATSTDSPQTVVVDDFGNAQLNFTALAYPTDFPEFAGVTTDCTASSQIAANGACTMTIDFSPITLSTTSLTTLLSEDVDLTTNALNTKNGDAQAVPVSGTETQPELEVATPTISPAPGSYTSPQTVLISDATEGAAIYYTTDGKAPVVGASDTTLYTSAGVTVSSSETINAIGVLAGYINSGVATGTYAIAGDFVINATNAAATVQPGGSGVFTFAVTPTDGATTFPLEVTLSVSGLPAGATFILSPTSIAAGAAATTVTLTIQVPQASAAARPENGSGGHLASRLAPLSLALLLLPLLGRLRKSGRRFSRMLAILVLLGAGAAAMTGLGGCGSTVGFFGQVPRSYTVTLTGNMGALTHASNVTLTVE